ncbi:MAG: PH domain-containing protein [Thermoanaerobaculia bacterium]
MGYVEEMLAGGETVMHRTRRHRIVLLRSVAGPLTLVVLGGLMAGLFGLERWEGRLTGAWVGVGLAAFGFLFALPAWLRWRSEIYLVTDRRVIQVEGVVRKQALDSSLAKVNDVRLSQSLAGRLLGYGTLEIITASETGINRLDDLPRPIAFKKAMMAAAEAFAGRTTGPREPAAPPPAAEPPPAARSVADRLAELDDLRRRGLVSSEEFRAKRLEILEEI